MFTSGRDKRRPHGDSRDGGSRTSHSHASVKKDVRREKEVRRVREEDGVGEPWVVEGEPVGMASKVAEQGVERDRVSYRLGKLEEVVSRVEEWMVRLEQRSVEEGRATSGVFGSLDERFREVVEKFDEREKGEVEKWKRMVRMVVGAVKQAVLESGKVEVGTSLGDVRSVTEAGEEGVEKRGSTGRKLDALSHVRGGDPAVLLRKGKVVEDKVVVDDEVSSGVGEKVVVVGVPEKEELEGCKEPEGCDGKKNGGVFKVVGSVPPVLPVEYKKPAFLSRK